MPATAMRPERFLPRKQVPTQRDREIYRAVDAGKTQQEVAREFGGSQPRVAQVVRRVGEWAEEWTPPDLVDQAAAEIAAEAGDTVPGDTAALDAEQGVAAFSPSERLNLAEWVALERLEFVYGQSVAGWQKSQQDERQSVVRHFGDKVIREERTKSQCGRVGFLNEAMRAATALARLQGVDVTGKEARKAAEQSRRESEQRRPAPQPAPAPEATVAENQVELPADRHSAHRAEQAPSLSSRVLARTTYNRCDSESKSACERLSDGPDRNGFANTGDLEDLAGQSSFSGASQLAEAS